MIRFMYKQGSTVVVKDTQSEGLDAVVDAFKEFLRHCTFHDDNVDAITYDYEPRQPFVRATYPQCEDENFYSDCKD